MGAVAEQGTKPLTISEVWMAVRAARRKHRDSGLVPVLVTMHPCDLADLRYEDARSELLAYDMVRNCWTVYGVPITERQVPGTTSHRAIVLQRAPLVPVRMPKDWRTLSVQDMNRIVTEEF